MREVPVRLSPSIFYWLPTDRAFRAGAWAGVLLSVMALSGLPQRAGAVTAALVWAALYVLYISFINVGQTFYSFGWESLLVETGFFTIFAGASFTPPHVLLNWIYRWTLFRLMFGAGLIKLRGDACWRDLSCLDYFFETQPMPNPLSWYMHHLPRSVLHGGVAFNHFVELVVPFGFFLPQPYAGIAGLFTIVFQLAADRRRQPVMAELADPCARDHVHSTTDSFRGCRCRCRRCNRYHDAQRIAVAGLAVVVLMLSIAPTVNMLSPAQVMNTSFNPLQIVNTYGAFGSITRTRDEIVIEGTDAETVTDTSVWREYEFKGSRAIRARMPPQVAPYHLRLDWLMWFAAMSSAVGLPVVSRADGQAAAGGSRGVGPAAIQSVSGSPAAVDPCRAVSLPIHDRGRTPADRPMVEPGARVSVSSRPSACGLEHPVSWPDRARVPAGLRRCPRAPAGSSAATWIASFRSRASIR